MPCRCFVLEYFGSLFETKICNMRSIINMDDDYEDVVVDLGALAMSPQMIPEIVQI